MADVATLADSIRIYLTGASSHAGYQADHALSLGLYRGTTKTESLTPDHTSPIQNIRFDFIEGYNGTGIASLTAATENSLVWTPPNGSPGTAVTILNGETKVISGSDPSKYVIVTRTSADSLGGTNTIQLVDTHDNVIGGAIFDSAEAAAGEEKYRALMLANDNASLSATSVTAYLNPLSPAVSGGLTTVLGASGAGTIVKAGAFTYVRTRGMLEIRTSGGSVREIVYYVKTDANTLSVASDKRGLKGTSAAAGAGTDILYFPPMARIAKEAPTANALTDETTNGELTQPGGLTWSLASTAALGVSIGTLAVGAQYGLWVERFTIPGTYADARLPIQIVISFVVSGVTYTKHLRGYGRVANDGLARWEWFDGQDAEADYDNDTPDTTFTSSPLVRSHALGHTYYEAVRYRNRFDLYGPVTKNTLVVAADGTAQTDRPRGPAIITIKTTSTGALLIGAIYYPLQEAPTFAELVAKRANTWLIYLSVDGTPPDPLLDTPIEVAMSGIPDHEDLSYTTADLYLDGTPAEVLVRTRRTDTYLKIVESITRSGSTATVTLTGHGWVTGKTILHSGADQSEYNIAAAITVIDADTYTYTVSGTPTTPATWPDSGYITAEVDGGVVSDSDNVDTASLTIDLCGPSRPSGYAMYGRAAGAYQSPITVENSTIVVDAGANIYWEMKVGETLLWYDTLLIFRILYRSDGDSRNGLYTTFNWSLQQSVSGAGSDDALEIVNATNEWYITVNGVRRVKIDPSATTIYFLGDTDFRTAPNECCGSDPAVRKYATTCIQVFDPVTYDYITPFSIQSDGTAYFDIDLTTKATQAEVLA